MKYVQTFLILLTLPAVALADEVRLKNGGKIVGIAREENGFVVVELKIGTATVPKSDVVEIVPGRTTLHEYYERYARLARSASADDYVALAVWAKSNGVTRFVNDLLEAAIRVDPEHRTAREMLGYIRHDDRWMTRTEYMQALGCVLFRGNWVRPADRDAVLALEAAKREEARRLAEQRKAEQRARAEREVVYTLGLPSYATRSSRVWTSGWSYGWPWYHYVPLHGTYRSYHGTTGWHYGGRGGHPAGGHHGPAGGHGGGFGGHR